MALLPVVNGTGEHAGRRVAGDPDPSAMVMGSEDFAGWMFTVKFGELGEVTGFAIDATSWHAPEEPLNATFVHRVPVGAIIASARTWAGMAARSRAHRDAQDSAGGDEVRFAELLAEGQPAEIQQWAALVTARTGVRGKDDRVFAEVANQYVLLVGAGERAPLKKLAEVLHVSRSRARNVVLEARKRGLLTETKPGRAGGDLTAKARRLLEGS